MQPWRTSVSTGNKLSASPSLLSYSHMTIELTSADTMYIMFTVWGCCFFGSTKVRPRIALLVSPMLISDWLNKNLQDPFYDSEGYRKDGGDGSVHWIYEKVLKIHFSGCFFFGIVSQPSWWIYIQQEDIEESARAELWREELIEEIEQKVGGLRELEEARKEEELVKWKAANLLDDHHQGYLFNIMNWILNMNSYILVWFRIMLLNV